jgi:hypothetical protein
MHMLYELHGIVLKSEIAFPELELRRCAFDAQPDVTVAVCKFEPHSAVAGMPDFQVEADFARIALPGIGRYRVYRGCDVLVDPDAQADPALIRLFILGLIMGVVFHQRGVLPLHASAVELGGEALAFVGSQGQGKSTLAAHCLALGATRLIADDILVISFDKEGSPWAHPGMPSLKLWRDALQMIGQPTDTLRPDWHRADKFHLPMAGRLSEGPVPVKRIYLLSEDPDASVGRIEPIAGAAAAVTLISHTYQVDLLDAKTQRKRHFITATQLASRIAVRRLTRRLDPGQVLETAKAVIEDGGTTMEVVQ